MKCMQLVCVGIVECKCLKSRKAHLIDDKNKIYIEEIVANETEVENKDKKSFEVRLANSKIKQFPMLQTSVLKLNVPEMCVPVSVSLSVFLSLSLTTCLSHTS